MMPIYRHTDSYPNQRHLNFFPNYPSNPPTMAYEPSWPHSGFYGYPPMMPTGPSYPFPVPYHPMYYLPPPYYSSELPRFEYEKHVPWNQERHCCGCPNHRHQEGPRENGSPANWIPEEDNPKEKERNGFDGDGKTGEEKECSFPIVWMPSWDKTARQKDERDANVSPVEQEPDGLPYLFNFLPMKRILNEGDSKENAKNESEKPKSEETRKGSEAEGNKKPAQPPKPSKLPPVCLRVDPLPKKNKKRSGNESSRSPSPPRDQENDTRKSSNEDNPLPKKSDPKVIAVTEKGGDQQQVHVERTNAEPSENEADRKSVKDDEKMPSKNEPDRKAVKDDEEMPSENEPDREAVKDDEKMPSENEHNQKAVKDDEKMPSENEPDQKAAKDEEKTKGFWKEMSDTEAAVRIQSAYRGFEIRRSQPLKKLRLISEVSSQAEEVRDRIRTMESSCDNKQKLIIGETIMRLLLQLDTIQGLHPSLRDIRKSLAKELVVLQEKLDSLAIEPVEPEPEAFSSRPVEEKDIVAESKQEQLERDDRSDHVLRATLPSQDQLVLDTGRDVQVEHEEPSSEATMKHEYAEESMGDEKTSEVLVEEEAAVEPEAAINLEGKGVGGDGPVEADMDDLKESELGNNPTAVETLSEPCEVKSSLEKAEVELFAMGHESEKCSDKEAEEEPIRVVSAEPETEKEDSAEEVRTNEPDLEMEKSNKEQGIPKETERLREMLETLLEAGKSQMSLISTLSSKVNDLEIKLSKRNRKKKPRSNRRLKDRAVCSGI